MQKKLDGLARALKQLDGAATARQRQITDGTIPPGGVILPRDVTPRHPPGTVLDAWGRPMNLSKD